MKRIALALVALLLALSASASFINTSGSRCFGCASGGGAPTVGSLVVPGGSSTANSGAVRIARTGSMDVNTFTIEMWLTPSATAANNGQTIAEGADYASTATNGNIIWDADNFGTRGFILGLSGGRIYIGVATSAGSYTLIGSTDLRDGLTHHVFFYRNASTGLMRLGVDGVREDSVTGPIGLVTYDGDGPATDAYHYVGKEKLNLTFGFNGLASEIRVSDIQRYTGTTYTVPTAPFTADANTVGLYHMGEQAGTSMGDSSGNSIAGELVGSPVPTWSTASPFP